MKNKKENYDEEIEIYWKDLLLIMLKYDIFVLNFKGNKLNKKTESGIKKYNILEKKFEGKKLNVAIERNARFSYLKKLGNSNDTKKSNNKIYQLTKEGIEIALKLQEHEDNKINSQKQEIMSKIIIYLTFILSIGAIADIINLISNSDYNILKFLSFIIILIIVGTSLIILFKQNN